MQKKSYRALTTLRFTSAILSHMQLAKPSLLILLKGHLVSVETMFHRVGPMAEKSLFLVKIL